MTATYTKGHYYKIPINDLQTDSNQPRKYFDPEALEDLVNSIQGKGVLQPILFRVDNDGTLFIVAGERRLLAARKAGLETIPALLVDGNASEIALVENLLREDLTAIELAEALNRIQTEHNYTQEQLIPLIGKAKSTVSEILSLNKLPETIRDECRNNPKIPRKTLISIAKKKKEAGMTSAFEKYKEKLTASKQRGRKKGQKYSVVDRIGTRYESFAKFLNDQDFKKADSSARSQLITLIEEWKKIADSLIERIQTTPAYENPPDKKAASGKSVKPPKEPKKKSSKGTKTETKNSQE